LQERVSVYVVAKPLGDTVAMIERVYGHFSAADVAAAIGRKGL